MDMRVDADRIRLERTNRAWSQEHLANVTDLGLRTVQRIEAAGTASNESISAIASAFELPVPALLVREVAARRRTWATFIAAKRLWILSSLILLVQVVSPPVLSVAQVGLLAWASVEAALVLAKRRSQKIL